MALPTGENLQVEHDHDYIPGASVFFQLDENEDLTDYTPCEGLPSNPQDYLKSVMLEAQQCPNVVVASVKPEATGKHSTPMTYKQTPLPGSQHAPSEEWCKSRLRNFCKAREAYFRHMAQLKSINRQSKKRPKLPIYPLPAWDDEGNWRYLCLGNKKKPIHDETSEADVTIDQDSIQFANEKTESEDNENRKDQDVMAAMAASGVSNLPMNEDLSPEGEEDDGMIELSTLEDGYPPMLRILLRMEPKQVQSNLNYHVEWIRTYGFSNHQGRWIYALLTCLEKPLYPSVISTLRDLSRQCAALRPSAEKLEESELNGLNLIICLIAQYFDQKDLQDEVF
ncbi:unnamed protein product [Clavelina lepadiformis]|uniref:Gem-associated protein 2 n=1 Tax=Clavelina lepadiformis TaxID=159417 RepID=A0ABP0GB15_CLALP